MCSKRRLRKRSCTGKKAYTSEQEARADARYLALRDHRPVNHYRCSLCGKGWHVGHRRGWLRQAIAARRGR